MVYDRRPSWRHWRVSGEVLFSRGSSSSYSKPLTGTNPIGMSIPMQFEDSMVGKMNSCELDVIEELKVEERKNLFAVFPIGTIIQNGGNRKRSVAEV